jgi:DNA-binding transcriptional regulator YhcF (GntR family)
MKTSRENDGLAGEAYPIVRERILRGELSTGQVIWRRKLAAELGMSLLPMSEAMLRLEQEGLVESRRRAGTRIRVPTPQDVRGHYIVREALEVQAAKLFAEIATSEERAELLKLAATHAEFPSQNLTAEEQVPLADMGAVTEHGFTTTHTGKAEWGTVFENVKRTGPERCRLSTDLGQTVSPTVSEGFALFAQNFLEAGFSKTETRRMAVKNSSDWVE